MVGLARRRRPTLGLAAFLVSDGPYDLVGLGMSKSLQFFGEKIIERGGFFYSRRLNLG